MPRKIYCDQKNHRYVRSNSQYGFLWMHYTYKPGYHGVPYAPSWRKKWKKPALIHNGGKS